MINNIPSPDIDFNKYKQSLIAYLRTFPQYTDYDFTGSNFDVLLNILSYNAFNLAHYDNMVGNEAWIDTAELRQSQVSHATDLNYLPRSRVSAQSTLQVEVFPDDNPPSITLPRYYKFKSSDPNGNTIFFVTDRDYVATRVNNRYVFSDVLVYEGTIAEESFEVSGVTVVNQNTIYTEPFVIASQNIDIRSLQVFVKQSNNDVNAIEYSYAQTLDQTTTSSQTYFIRGIYDNQYAIEFGDGVFGAPISNGNVVLIRYRNTKGEITQGNYQISKTTAISGYNDIVVNSATRVNGGFERETVEQIRFNAPRYFQTRDRAVTSVDYQVIVQKSFPNIQHVYAFGGEEIQQYGKVMIVLKPIGTTGVVSNSIKNQIIALLKNKNIVPEPIILDPVYYYLGITGNVFYNSDIITGTPEQVRSNIITNLVDLNNSNQVGNFGVQIYQSLINDVIADSDRSIIGNDIALDLRKRWTPGLNLNETLKFTSNNKFYKSRDGAYRTPTDYTVTTTSFNIFINGVVTNVIIQDDGIGNLFYHSVDSQGNKIRIGQAIGSIDYDTGSVNLIANILSYDNYILFVFRLDTKSVGVVRDSFVLVDGADINIEMKKGNNVS